MERLTVELGERTSEIMIAHGLLDQADTCLADHVHNGRMIVVTDANVAKDQLPRLSQSMANAGVTIDLIVLSSGEATKSWDHLQFLCDQLAAKSVRRSEPIVALGGGVIGDIAGLAAALHLRGCGLIQVPTSLLAQVDSSVGGKVAIDTAAGKNMVGAFYQPDLVLIDPACLTTLPRRELLSGFAELAKYGLIADPDFFEWCSAHADAVLGLDPDTLTHAISHAVKTKAKVVEADERDAEGHRALLNLGHSFAHALETAAGYDGSLLHGEAVAAGMSLAFGYSVAQGLCRGTDADKLVAFLNKTGLPSGIPDAAAGATASQIVGLMGADKKNEINGLTLILTKGIGKTFISHDVDPTSVTAYLETLRR